MKKMSLLLAAIVVSLSVCFATQVGNEEPYERNYSLEGLPVYVKNIRKGASQSSLNEYKVDTTTLVFLIKQSVDPDGWGEEGIKISATNHKGMDVLRIVQTPSNHEEITDLLSKLKKASPHYVDNDVELFGVAPTK
ncbi:MAG: hypothetical protein MUC43_18600 [Pirellula sp.]|nr:hypothetical protein [Pirellula sp.]